MSESRTLDKDGVKIKDDSEKAITLHDLIPAKKEITKEHVDNFVKKFSAKQKAIEKARKEVEEKEKKELKKKDNKEGKNDNSSPSNKE
jgi:hypothetical protein